jgi:DNA modification methylase
VTTRGEMVLDPFAGSGSVTISAEKVGRISRAIELDPLYVDVAVRRWQAWSGGEARLVATGRTFAQVAEERAEDGA